MIDHCNYQTAKYKDGEIKHPQQFELLGAAFINDGPIVCINNLDNPSLWIYDHRYSIRAIPEEAGGNLSTEKWIQVTNISQNNRIIVGTL